jgi:hypothetical protein
MGRPIIHREQLHRLWACRLAGNNIKQTARLTGVARNTVRKWGSDEVVEALRLLVDSRPATLVVDPLG